MKNLSSSKVFVLPKEIATFLIEKKMPDHLSKKWERLKNSALPVFDLLKKWPLNQNKWAEILDFLYDISKRDEKEAKIVLLEVMKELPETEDLFFKTDKLREALRTKRYPYLQSKKIKFDEAIKSLKVPQEVSVTSHPFFENDIIEIKIKADDKTDLRQIFEELVTKDWKSIFVTI